MTTFSELDTFEPASHDGFLALLPAICDGDCYAMRGLWAHEQGRADVAYATPLGTSGAT